jgi:hypothetical protein
MPPRDADEWGLPEGYDESDDFCIKNTPGRPGVLHFKGSARLSSQKGSAELAEIHPGQSIVLSSTL